MIPLLKFERALRGMLIKDKTAHELLWEQLMGLMTYQEPFPLTEAAVINWDISRYYNAEVTLTASRTLAVNNLTAGDYGTIKVIQGGTGSYALTLPTNPVSKSANGGAGAITLTAAAGSVDVLSFYYDGTNLLWNASLNFT